MLRVLTALLAGLCLASCATPVAAPGVSLAASQPVPDVGDGALPARIISGGPVEATPAPPPARITPPALRRPAPADPAPTNTAYEAEIAQLINAYRAAQGLSPVPVSPALTEVARAHALDLRDNTPDRGQCNMHSWSSAGDWTPVCYTDDHQFAEAMWSKPAEITGGDYPYRGFEIAYRTVFRAAPGAALSGWQASPRHNNVILQQGRWTGTRWRAMGVGVAGGYAVVWFGRREDPAG